MAHRDGIAQAVRYLRSLGHRRIALFSAGVGRRPTDDFLLERLGEGEGQPAKAVDIPMELVVRESCAARICNRIVDEVDHSVIPFRTSLRRAKASRCRVSSGIASRGTIELLRSPRYSRPCSYSRSAC
jgi:hypothetical protein